VLFEQNYGLPSRQACFKPSSLTKEQAQKKYADRVVMVMRSGCTFAQKWSVLKELNAKGMVVVQHEEGAFPFMMYFGECQPHDPQCPAAALGEYDYHQAHPNGIGAPACMAFYSVWDRLAALSGVYASFANMRKYRGVQDEVLPKPDITGIRVSQPLGPPQEVPVAQATFNPQVLSPTIGRARVVSFDPLCFADPGQESYGYYFVFSEQCKQCRRLASVVKDGQAVRGSVAIVRFNEDTYYCFQYMYELVARLQVRSLK
jgi:hypothetical protein